MGKVCNIQVFSQGLWGGGGRIIPKDIIIRPFNYAKNIANSNCVRTTFGEKGAWEGLSVIQCFCPLKNSTRIFDQMI